MYLGSAKRKYDFRIINVAYNTLDKIYMHFGQFSRLLLSSESDKTMTFHSIARNRVDEVNRKHYVLIVVLG